MGDVIDKMLLEQDDTILHSKADIEQYFKNVQFVHTHDISDNDNTIFKPIALNGSFTKTIYICENDDLFVSFEHQTIVISSLPEFWDAYTQHINTHNIVLDFRMTNYIAYAVMKYGDDLLILDISTRKVRTIYWYCSKYFQIQTNELTIQQIKQLFITNLLLLTFVRPLNIEWNNIRLIKYIKSNDASIASGSLRNIFDMLICYIRIQQSSDVSSKNITQVLSYFNRYFSDMAFTSEKCPRDIHSPWNVHNLKLYEFYVALSILKNNNFSIQI